LRNNEPEREPDRGQLCLFFELNRCRAAQAGESQGGVIDFCACTTGRFDFLTGDAVNILICEDDEDQATLLAEEYLDYFEDSICTMVAHGDQAVKELERTPYDFINMDMNIPGIKGHEIIRRIREGNGPNKNTPIILLSAEVNDSSAEFSRESVVRIQKPVQVEKVLEIAAVMTNYFKKSFDSPPG
jgi:CheY-like chemotaxis protein